MLALVLACATPPPLDSAPAPDEPTTGSVEGMLRLVRSSGEGDGFRHAVVYLRSEGEGTGEAGVRHLRLLESGFEEELVAAGPGDAIRVVNESRVQHRLFWLERGRRVEVEVPTDASGVELPITERGVVRIYCDLHAEEYVSVFGAPSRHAAVVDFGASFAIEGVEPGSWTLHLWSEYVEGPVRGIMVVPGLATREDVWIDPRLGRGR